MKIRLFGLLLAAIVTSSHSHAAIIIDDYSAGAPIAQFGAGRSDDSTTDGSILGGSRDASITVRDLDGDEDSGTLTFTDDVSIGQGPEDQNFGSLTYDGFSNLDLTQGGANNRFLLSIVSSDAPTQLADVISLAAGSGADFAEQFVTIPSAAELASGPQEVYIDFADFAPVDFSSLDTIVLGFDFENHPGRDVTIAFFGATTPASVPEPAGGILLSVMSFIVLMRRRRS